MSSCSIFKKDLPPGPKKLYGEELPTEIATLVYIIDTSCSMDSAWQTFTDEYGNSVSGYRMDRAKSEVIISLNQMDESNRFDVVVFQSEGVTALFEEMRQADEENTSQAVGWIGELSAKGATETGVGPAVAWALENPAYAEVMDYVLVTGGAPACTDNPGEHLEEQLRMIREANGKSAVIHVALITPNCIEANTFAEALVEETGGTLTILE
jgi:hypothetical protein